MQPISASNIAEFETGTHSEEESDQKQLDVDVLLNMGSDNERLDSPPQVCTVTISKFPSAADFPIQI